MESSSKAAGLQSGAMARSTKAILSVADSSNLNNCWMTGMNEELKVSCLATRPSRSATCSSVAYIDIVSMHTGQSKARSGPANLAHLSLRVAELLLFACREFWRRVVFAGYGSLFVDDVAILVC